MSPGAGLPFLRHLRNMWSLDPQICREFSPTFTRKNCGLRFTNPLKTSACLVSPLESYSMPLNPHIEPPLNTKIMRNKNRKTPRCGSAWSANQRRPNRWRSDTSVLLVLSFGFLEVEIMNGQSPHGSTNLRNDPLWCHVAASKISHHHCHVCCKRVWVVYCRFLKINPIVGVFSINHSLPKTAYRRLLSLGGPSVERQSGSRLFDPMLPVRWRFQRCGHWKNVPFNSSAT